MAFVDEIDVLVPAAVSRKPHRRHRLLALLGADRTRGGRLCRLAPSRRLCGTTCALGRARRLGARLGVHRGGSADGLPARRRNGFTRAMNEREPHVLAERVVAPYLAYDDLV